VDQFVDLLYLRLGVSNIPIVFVTLDAFVVVFLIFLFLSSVEIPENGGDHLLLSEEFLRSCFQCYQGGLRQTHRHFSKSILT
jgi:hypothetical protein